MVKQGVWHLSTESQFRWSFRLNLCDILFTEFWFPTFWKESKSSLIYWRCCKRVYLVLSRQYHKRKLEKQQGEEEEWHSWPHNPYSAGSRTDPVLIPREVLIIGPSLSWGQITEAFLKVKRCIENKNRGGTEVCSLQCDKDSKASWPTSDSFFFFFLSLESI